ncbi:hypothetical protein ES702_00212 [subsurface metagenome]
MIPADNSPSSSRPPQALTHLIEQPSSTKSNAMLPNPGSRRDSQLLQSVISIRHSITPRIPPHLHHHQRPKKHMPPTPFHSHIPSSVSHSIPEHTDKHVNLIQTSPLLYFPPNHIPNPSHVINSVNSPPSASPNTPHSSSKARRS